MRTTIALALLSLPAAAGAQEYQPPKPTKFHEYLKQFEGAWDAVSKFQMQPGQPPVESKGSEVAKLTSGGLWLVFEYKGDMFGQPFTGHGVMGYDTQKKKFVGTWVDSMATGLFLSEGTCDDKGKVFTSVMEGTDPESGKPMKMKHVSEIKDADRKTLTFYTDGPDGKETAVGTIEYTRRKGDK